MLLPTAAKAHLVGGAGIGDFYAGLLHPLTAVEHALPLLALGLVAGLQTPAVARWALIAVPLGVLTGAGLAFAAPSLGALPWNDATSCVVLGLLAASGWRLSVTILAGLGWLCGLTQGYENTSAMTSGMTVPLFVCGVIAAGLLTLPLIAGSGIYLARSVAWARIAMRAAGSWIAAIGLMVVVV